MKKRLMTLLALPFLAYGSLPYEGVSTCVGPIYTPTESKLVKIDAGYLVDKDCSTIFVKPPKTGDAVVESATLEGGADQCDVFTEAMEQNSGYLKMLRDIDKAVFNSTSLTTQEIEAFKFKRTLASDGYDRTLEILNKSKNNIGLVAKVKFETQWDLLRKAYDKANPSKTVKLLPVVASSISVISKKQGDDLTASITEDNTATNGMYDFVIPGVRFSSSIDLLEYIGVSDLDTNTYKFGESLTGQLQLNHYGMCKLKKFFEDYTNIDPNDDQKQTLRELNKDLIKSSLDTKIIANLNVWYPVYLNKRYKVSLDIDKVSNGIHNFVKTKNTFSTTEFVDIIDKLETTQSVKIELFSDHAGEDTQADIENIKTQIIDDVALKLMNQVADAQPESIEYLDLEVPNDPHIMVTNTRRLCRTKRRLFSKSRKCWTEQYQVKKVVDGVANGRVEKLQTFAAKYNEDVSIFSTILRSTTLGFTKEEK